MIRKIRNIDSKMIGNNGKVMWTPSCPVAVTLEPTLMVFWRRLGEADVEVCEKYTRLWYCEGLKSLRLLKDAKKYMQVFIQGGHDCRDDAHC